MTPLTIPPAAQRDNDAVQMLSAWIAEKGLHCSIKVGMWKAQGHDEPRAWGILLADVIRHIANAVESEEGVEDSETVSEIIESLLEELNDPTSKASGAFHPDHS